MNLLTAIYDLQFGPVSFDVVSFLVRALSVVQQRGCDALHVVVVPYERGLGGFSRHWGGHDEHSARWRLHHIVIPACALAGATVTIAGSVAHANDVVRAVGRGAVWWPEGKAHHAGPIVQASRAGRHPAKLRASEAARRYVAQWMRPGTIVITERAQATDPARNSNVMAQRDLVVWIERNLGMNALLLSESVAALCRGFGYGELDLDLRMAIYERAALNIIGNAGPQQLLWYSDAAFLQFEAAMPFDVWERHWAEHLALARGEQLPWARQDQRLVYQPATFETMQREVARWAGKRVAECVGIPPIVRWPGRPAVTH